MNALLESSATLLSHAVDLLSALLVFILGAAILAAAVMYVHDRRQTTHTILRNYPLLGRFRYGFEKLGEFFRQYLYSGEREELPFNRAQRAWVYRAAKNLDNTQAFGSTRAADKAGNVVFVNAGYPMQEHEATDPEEIVFGPHCREPYRSRSLFNISGMSFGAISKPAVIALSRGARTAGCWLNTGEGGLSQWHLEGGCDLVFQIGTARYGVRDETGALSEERLRGIAALPEVRMFELKLSQGAKPGKGGILPAVKVTPEIAAIRCIPAGIDSISPNRHPDIANHAQLLDRLAWLREVTGKPVGIKAVLGDPAWLDGLLALVRRRGEEWAPDFITLDSGDGGTGAAPMSLIDDMGLHIRETLPLLVNRLAEHDLRGRIPVIASGKLINPADVAWALCTGADCVVSARGFMFSLGCVQAMQCNRNTCPTGITTHDPRLQRGLVAKDKAQRVAHYHANMMKELKTIALSCGVSNARLLRRRHARMINGAGRSVGLEEIYGTVEAHSDASREIHEPA